MTKREDGQTTQDLVAALSLASLHGQESETPHLSDQAVIGESPFPAKGMRWGWNPNIPKGNKTG